MMAWSFPHPRSLLKRRPDVKMFRVTISPSSWHRSHGGDASLVATHWIVRDNFGSTRRRDGMMSVRRGVGRGYGSTRGRDGMMSVWRGVGRGYRTWQGVCVCHSVRGGVVYRPTVGRCGRQLRVYRPPPIIESVGPLAGGIVHPAVSARHNRWNVESATVGGEQGGEEGSLNAGVGVGVGVFCQWTRMMTCNARCQWHKCGCLVRPVQDACLMNMAAPVIVRSYR